MVRRFQIEDMVAQDTSGVVFRAIDAESGLPVAVRRFFPFGVNGGGLSEEEQVDYDTAVGRLADIKHPALRAIISGGCDPVDGMPFIATEWIEGGALQDYIERGPLSAAEAIHLISQALEACERISEVFGQEAVWIETNVHTIIVGAEGSGRGITFWICPLKWLGKNDGQRGLDAIVSLTEDAMKWTGKTILDFDGGGLGGWLNWLRTSARKATLTEARERLLGISNVAAPAPVKRVVRQAAPAARIKPPKRKSNLSFVFGGIAVLLLISIGGWALIRWNNSRLAVMPTLASPEVVETKPTVPKRSHKTVPKEDKTAELESPVSRDSQPRLTTRTPEQLSQAAAELSVLVEQSDRDKAAEDAARNAEIASRKGIFTPEDSALLLAMSGEEVTVTGILKGFKYSKSGATQYLVFSDDPASGEIRGSVLLRNAPATIKEDQLSTLKGKKISLRGKIQIENFGTTPMISIKSRDAIQEIK